MLLSLTACARVENKENQLDGDSGNAVNETQQIVESRPTIQEEIDAVESEMQERKSVEEIREMEVVKNSYSTLNVPTDVEKIEDIYFIVDCYNNQVIYSADLTAPLTEWNVMCDIMNKGHTIASDGTSYLIDDTENNRVLVYEKREGKFELIQILNHVGERPHYVRYDQGTDAFYVLSSMTGKIYVLKEKENESDIPEMYVEDIQRFDQISNTYCRSFTIDGDRILLPASNGLIIEASFPAFQEIATYQAPNEIAGLAQIYEADQQYYLTVSTNGEGNQDYATLVCTDSLQDLSEGKYSDLYDTLEPDRPGTGTPYNISSFGGQYYLMEHRHGHGLFQFDIEDQRIQNVEIIH
ncbi:MAG: hypothetical protein PHE02_02160 [Lachnospiraceae bacterium]|nr:hypothetical protein [Lachnospiraceae bacterium]